MIRMTSIAIAATVLMAVGPQNHVASAQAPTASKSGLGSRIVFSSTQHVIPEAPRLLDPRMQLYVMNADGSEQRQITDFIGVKLGAACSPNNQQIAFHAALTPFNSRPLVPSIFLMDADT